MQPISQPDRYVPIDVLRGVALFGVLLVNLLTIFRVSLFGHMTGLDAPHDMPGIVIDKAMSILLEFKAFTLFSFLFGVGAAIQHERVAKARNPELFLFRRFLVLLAFGLVHILLIWNGDILTLYAVCGFLMIPFLRLSPLWIAVGGVAVLTFSAYGTGILPVHLPSDAAVRNHAIEATRVYAQGGFAEILAFRWHETRDFMLPLLVWTVPRSWGVMLLGAAAWRSKLLTERRPLWLPTLVAAVTVAIAAIVLHSDFTLQLSLACAYAAAVLLWLPKASLFAAGGQMAFTNYLTESVVFTLVFYGFGLGLFGKLGILPVTLGGIAFYIAQLYFSRWWLQRYQFGPMEWAWRSLTYGRLYSLRKVSTGSTPVARRAGR